MLYETKLQYDWTNSADRCAFKEAVRLFSAVPTESIMADVSADSYTRRCNVAPLEGCHTSITHTTIQ